MRFSDRPLLLSTVFIALIAVFKSYPGVGDVGFYLSLLPLFSHLVPFMKQVNRYSLYKVKGEYIAR